MNYPFILKFSSLRNLSDARYAAGMWADMVGFCFDPGHEAYTEPSKASEILSWISGPAFCAEFGMQPPEWINEFTGRLKPDILQIPSTYDRMAELNTEGMRILLYVSETGRHDNFEKADMFICSSKEVYAGLKSLTDKPVILHTEDTGTDASDTDGISFPGGTEDRPGTRNHAEWTAFLEKWEL